MKWQLLAPVQVGLHWTGLGCLPGSLSPLVAVGFYLREKESMRETHLCLFLTSSVPEHSTPPFLYSNSTLGPPPLQLPRPSCSPASGWPLHPPRSVSRSPPRRPAPLAPAIEFHSGPSVPQCHIHIHVLQFQRIFSSSFY